jgi:P-type E1-E2 ATPase
MKPNQKQKIIQIYQEKLDKIVAMVGDGTNDCAALK